MSRWGLSIIEDSVEDSITESSRAGAFSFCDFGCFGEPMVFFGEPGGVALQFNFEFLGVREDPLRLSPAACPLAVKDGVSLSGCGPWESGETDRGVSAIGEIRLKPSDWLSSTAVGLPCATEPRLCYGVSFWLPVG